jgi:CO/xanthine dehydrogenase Mo-binding subunit
MSATALPENLKAHPRLGQWLDLAPDGRIRAYSGKVDIGQGILHALRLIVAEELEIPIQQVVMERATTLRSPDEGVTSGSLSIQQSGTALRYAAAHLREACRIRCAAVSGVLPGAVRLENGRFRAEASNVRARYGELIDPAMLVEPIDPSHLQARTGCRSKLGNVPRPDVAAKVFGEFEFINDMNLPHMCFGQVFRPRTLQADVEAAALKQTLNELSAIEGVIKVVHDGMLIGVLAECESALAKAAKLVDGDELWSGEAAVPAASKLASWLQSQPLDTTVIVDQQPAAPQPTPERVFTAEYGRAYLQHASVGLSCAIAQWLDGKLQVWSHSQGIYNLRRDLALAFGLPLEAVTVCHAEGAGCYGHNGADDVAFDAAWLARHAPGRAVRLQWTRQQEMANSPMGPAMTVFVETDVAADGKLLSWTQEVWSQGHGCRPGRGKTPALLGAWQTASPAPVTIAINQPPHTGGGSDRNATPPYVIPEVHVVNHRVLAMPLRVSALRSLGAHVNVLAAESTIDEIAKSLGRDPLHYRLAHLNDPRAKAVLLEVARIAGWDEEPEDAEEGFGRGIAFARYKNTGAYCAVVAELVIQEEVRLKNLYIAADVGLVVHPDGARNQLEGGAVQAASWTLREAAEIGREGIRSDDWESYPIFNFSDVPPVEVSLIDRPDSPSLGVGECSAGPTAAAIANAIEDALGVRIRSMPFTADELMKLAQSDDSGPDLF